MTFKIQDNQQNSCQISSMSSHRSSLMYSYPQLVVFSGEKKKKKRERTNTNECVCMQKSSEMEKVLIKKWDTICVFVTSADTKFRRVTQVNKLLFARLQCQQDPTEASAKSSFNLHPFLTVVAVTPYTSTE